ncbi:hypothetical protein EXIGLDRAFT_839285 [Exidia glandulosa HHB12029]|uniref:Uncharacterized protein n=1 Tax=Exidia glandulosa HHB12029 TaxID=1314781 RepID=A0A165F3W9_EXIGL|nr:hypothetical protein EXIGLDRAFT_839285 [Exidia glandulosa HHB12029]
MASPLPKLIQIRAAVFPRHATPAARRVVLDIFRRDLDQTITTHALHAECMKQDITVPERFIPRAVYGSGLTTKPENPRHPIRSVRYLKRVVLADLEERGIIQKVHGIRAPTPEELPILGERVAKIERRNMRKIRAGGEATGKVPEGIHVFPWTLTPRGRELLSSDNARGTTGEIDSAADHLDKDQLKLLKAGLVRFTQDEHGLYVAAKNHDSRPPPEMGVFAPRGASSTPRPPAWSPAQRPPAWSPAQRPPAWSPAQPPHSERPTGIYSTVPRSPPADGIARTTSGSHFQWTPSARRGLHTARTLTHIQSLWADAHPLPGANSAQASSSKSSSDAKASLPTIPEPCHNRAGKLDRNSQAPTVKHHLGAGASGLSLLRPRTEMQQPWSLLHAFHATPTDPASKFPLSTTLRSQTAGSFMASRTSRLTIRRITNDA